MFYDFLVYKCLIHVLLIRVSFCVTITISGNHTNCDFLIMQIFFVFAFLFIPPFLQTSCSQTPSLSFLEHHFTLAQRKRDFQYAVIRNGTTIRAATVFHRNVVQQEIEGLCINTSYSFNLTIVPRN
jgi:hypothetical protein